jgi:hypothetical protein
VFGGNRSAEFEQRLNGVSYAEIAAAGGGILSTVNATRDATEEELLRQALLRLQPLLAEGVTCLEIKSGYGLTLDSELKMLRVIRKLATLLPVDIQSTCLAAHALPPEYKDRAEDYIDFICDTLLPIVARENWRMPLTHSVSTLRSPQHKSSEFLMLHRLWGCRLNCMRNNSLPCMAVHWRQTITPCRRITLNTPPRKMLTPWRPAALSPSCCPAHGIYCVKNSTRP